MTAANCDACIGIVLGQAPGYRVEHGEAVKWGISETMLGAWMGCSMDRRAVEAMDWTLASAIYREVFWAGCRCDELTEGVDLSLLGWASVRGPAVALATLQDTLEIEETGAWNDETAEAARRADPETLIITYAILRRVRERGKAALRIKEQALRMYREHHS